ncbi:MAG: SGNH/GDSL hydrolase family protein [Planctomycetota bacterium]
MRKLRLLGNLALGAGVLLAVEGYCSLKESIPKYRSSPLLGYELVPGYRSDDENVNRQGLRGAEIGAKAAGERRVLAMGGSTTWGHKVDDDETWPVYLEQQLNADALSAAQQAAGATRVLNGGVSGWGLEQIVLALRHGQIERLQPDLVLVFEGWNMPLLAHSPAVAQFQPAIDAFQDRSGPLRSALVRRLHRIRREWHESETSQAPRSEPDSAPSREAEAAAKEIAAAVEAGVPRLWQELAELSAQHSLPIVGLAYPCLVQRPPPRDAAALAVYEAALRRNLGSAGTLPEVSARAEEHWRSGLDLVTASVTAAGLPLLQAGARMESRLPADPAAADALWASYFRDHAHFTPAGNAALAEAVALELAELGLLP